MKKLLLLAMLATGSVWSQVKVSVAGLKVIGKAHQIEGSDEELRPFNWSDGTEIALLIQSTGKAMMGLDQDGPKVTVFTDDQGTDFLKAKSRFSSKPYSFDMMPKKSEDGKALMTGLKSPGLPGKGAKVLMLKGELLVAMASKSELKKSVKVAVKKGEKLVVDGQTFTITKAEKPSWGDDLLEITLEGSFDPKDFKSFEFFDAGGEKLKSKRGSWSSSGAFGKKQVFVSYSFPKKVSEIMVRAEVWTDLEKIKVPFDLKFGAGL